MFPHSLSTNQVSVSHLPPPFWPPASELRGDDCRLILGCADEERRYRLLEAIPVQALVLAFDEQVDALSMSGPLLTALLPEQL